MWGKFKGVGKCTAIGFLTFSVSILGCGDGHDLHEILKTAPSSKIHEVLSTSSGPFETSNPYLETFSEKTTVPVELTFDQLRESTLSFQERSLGIVVKNQKLKNLLDQRGIRMGIRTNFNLLGNIDLVANYEGRSYSLRLTDATEYKIDSQKLERALLVKYKDSFDSQIQVSGSLYRSPYLSNLYLLDTLYRSAGGCFGYQCVEERTVYLLTQDELKRLRVLQ